MACCRSSTRTNNDNGNDSTNNNSLTTAPDGTVLGKDGSNGGTNPYYSSPGGASSPASGWKGKYAADGTEHATGSNYVPSVISNSTLQSYKTGKITALSALNESGNNPGAISLDTNHTYSYGTYQINVGTGTMNNYLSYVKQSNPDIYNTLNSVCPNGDSACLDSSAFQNAWSSLSSNSEFSDSQDSFIISTHLNNQISMLQSSGWNFDDMTTPEKQLVYSTAVQYGANNTQITNALSGLNQSTASEADVINAISDYKIQDVPNHSGFSSNPTAQISRIQKEREISLSGGA